MESKMKYLKESLKQDFVFLTVFVTLGFSPLFILSVY